MTDIKEEQYEKWLLAYRINKIVHKEDVLGSWENEKFDETRFQEINYFYNEIKKIPSKYYSIIIQWLYNEPIHYKGKYLNFEDIYNRERFREEEDKEANTVLGINILFQSIIFFESYEEKEPNNNLTKKYVNKIKRDLDYIICRRFFN